MLIFWNSQIISVPTYDKTEMHKHALLHLIISKKPVRVETRNVIEEGRLVFIGQDVPHKVALRTRDTLLFLIDPSSAIADAISNKYLKGQPSAVLHPDCQLSITGKSERDVVDLAKQILTDLGIYSEIPQRMDVRIKRILGKMDEREFLLKNVDELAREACLSNSRLSHLFKQETNMRLKNCILMHKLKMVYLDVQNFIGCGFRKNLKAIISFLSGKVRV